MANALNIAAGSAAAPAMAASQEAAAPAEKTLEEIAKLVAMHIGIDRPLNIPKGEENNYREIVDLYLGGVQLWNHRIGVANAKVQNPDSPSSLINRLKNNLRTVLSHAREELAPFYPT
jgi:hypothetical protein